MTEEQTPCRPTYSVTQKLSSGKNRKPNPASDLRRDHPALTAKVEAICGLATPPLAGRILFLGLHVHNDTIAVSLAPSDSPG